MMTPEAVDARHEALLCLHRAILAIESGCVHQAETHAMSAVAWMREIAHSLQPAESSPEPVDAGWRYQS